jgi:hypothetical protein
MVPALSAPGIVTMSDQQKPPADAPKDALPAPEAAKRDDLAGNLPAKPTSFAQQIFIWAMIILVGIIFGIGPSAGLILEGPKEIGEYKVDSAEVQRRQRIAVTLEQILGVPFAKRSWGEDAAVTYARDVRKARYAADQGLMPSGAEVERLVDAFMARTKGDRTYGAIFKDNRRSSELSDRDLQLWLAEEAALKALAARDVAAPVVPVAAGSTVQTLIEDKVVVDEVTLSVKPLLVEVKADDPELAATYEKLKNEARFAVPAATTVQVAAVDLAALAQAESVTDEQAKAYYDAHQAEFTPPAPAQAAPAEGQPPPAPPVPTVKPLAEVIDGIKATLREQAALAKAKAQVAAFEQVVEEQGLDEKDAAAFAAAARAAGLTVTEVHVPENRGEQEIALGAFGPLTQSFRLHAAKPGFISSPLTAKAGTPLLLRVLARKPGSAKPLSDPEVAKQVADHLAAQRAYAPLLAEAETLRAAAEAAGPGGLRAALGAEPAKQRWNATVETKDVPPLTDLTPPAPAGEAAGAPREPRSVLSLAVAGNPVMLAEGTSAGAEPTVKLVQVVGYKDAGALDDKALGENAQRVRQVVEGVISRQADLAIDGKLQSGG